MTSESTASIAAPTIVSSCHEQNPRPNEELEEHPEKADQVGPREIDNGHRDQRRE
jgi:hypothetical protein